MLRLTCLSALLCSILLVATGLAQIPKASDKPVWTIEYLKVVPGKFDPTLSYLDDNWVRTREKAKSQGAVLSYYRIAEAGSSEADRTIVLLTEYKDQAAYDGREELFASILKGLLGDDSVAVLREKHEHFYQTISTGVFQDYSDRSSPQFKLLAQK
ncbi:MAG: hypothetical protein WBR26_20750 [Candidatus Acidiferrum sp.]